MMQSPRQIIQAVINDLGDADEVIEALGREGWELVQRGWKAREADVWYFPPREYVVSPPLTGDMPVMMGATA